MIISHKFKFIFIKTLKTAGTSIEIFLSQQCGEDDIVTPILPHVAPHRARNYHGLWNPLPELLSNWGQDLQKTVASLKKREKFFNHIPSKTIKQRVPRRIWTSYFKFCVERNPWDKSLSHYHMIKDRTGGSLSLDDYFKKGEFCLNYPIYCNSKGDILVDRVIKYESLKAELAEVFKELGIPFNGSLGVRAKSEHRKDKRPYQEILSGAQRKAIETAFVKEINLHGYVFCAHSPT